MTKGSDTRSGLLWEVECILNECGEELPQVLLMENVPQVIGEKNIADFDEWRRFLRDKGYKNYTQILNAKDFGIPQNRARCFMVSILGDYYYEFPNPIPLTLKLKDMLEDEVDEKYYLSQRMINGMVSTKFAQYKLDKVIQNKEGVSDTIVALFDHAPQCIVEDRCIQVGQMYGTDAEPNPQAGRVYDENGLSPTLDTCSGENRMPKIAIKNATKQGYLEAEEGDGIDISSRMDTHRGTVQKDMAQTLKTTCDVGVVANNLRIRKLTPKECWRLMGFDDEDFDKASKVNSNTQLYKQAGNSIVVNVLEAIFKQML